MIRPPALPPLEGCPRPTDPPCSGLVSARVAPSTILMAPPKTQEDVELARIKADLELEKARIGDPDERARLYCRVATIFLVGSFLTVGFLGACWATVQISSKPAWLELSLAAISAVQSLVIWQLWARLRLRVARDEAVENRPIEPPGDPKREGEVSL